MKLTDEEKDLIKGMIEVQLDHAERCERIQNTKMAERQKAKDLKRVDLLKRILAEQ